MRIVGENAKGRLEGCEIAGNGGIGVFTKEGGDPTLVGCTIRDHADGAGLLVEADARGKAKVGARNAFARNAWGDVVRE